MDFNELQHKLFELDPADPKEDLAKLRGSLQNQSPVMESESQVDYVNNTVDVPEGSLPLDKDYSVNDFAALAGVINEGTQKSADQVRGNEPMPKAEPGRTKHPMQDRLVGEQDNKTLEEKLKTIDEKLDLIIKNLGINNQSVTTENKTQNLKSRQKNESTIKTDLYSRLNRILDDK